MLACLVKEKNQALKSEIDRLRTTDFQELYILTTMQKIISTLPRESHIILQMEKVQFLVSGQLSIIYEGQTYLISYEDNYLEEVLKLIYKGAKAQSQTFRKELAN
ncbi:MAG: hypothetical protein HN509_00860 [Halobacteriovoraceae bacterium]|jgi:hypothetical protein|nr:hypothetical protein [Halobacteriovoraceae bacterium]MBT5093615.1 hypothetical protein [Halobacteriovoraceae bacterium]